MPNAPTAEFQIQEDLWEELEPETDFERHQARLAEMLPEWKEQVDHLFAQAETEEAHSRKQIRELCERNLAEFRAALNDPEAQAARGADPDRRASQDAGAAADLNSLLAGQSPEFFEQVLKDMEERAVHAQSRDPALNPRYQETLVEFAGQAFDQMQFQDTAERIDFARIAAREVLDELAPVPEKPSPEWQEIRIWAENALAERYGVYHPDSFEQSRRSPALFLLDQLQQPEKAAEFVAGWQPEMAPQFTALDPESFLARYDLPGLDSAAQNRLMAAARQLADNNQREFGEPGYVPYPGMESAALHDRLNHPDPDTAAVAAWQDLKDLFQFQGFADANDCRIAAGAIAGAVNAALGYPAGYAPEYENDPAVFSRNYFQQALTDWLTSGRLSDEESWATAARLEAAAQAAQLWGQIPQEQRNMEFMTLTDLHQANGGALPEPLLLQQTGANFDEALTAMGSHSFRLQFNNMGSGEKLQLDDPHGLLETNGLDPNPYLRLINHSLERNRALLENGVEARQLMETDPEFRFGSHTPRELAGIQRAEFYGAEQDQKMLSGLIAEQIKEGSASLYFPTGLADMTPEAQLQELREIRPAVGEIGHPALKEVAMGYLQSIDTEYPDPERRPADQPLDEMQVAELTALRAVVELERIRRERQRA